MARRITMLRNSRLVVVGAMCVVVATLYFAQEVLIPLVLAMLLAFLLAPVVRFMERFRLGRVPAVLAVVGVAFGLVALLGWVVGEQVIHLAENVDQYRGEILSKVRRLSGQGGGLTTKIGQLGEDIKKATAASQPAAQGAQPGAAPRQPGSLPGRGPARIPGREPPGASGTASDPFYMIPLPAPRPPLKTLGEYLGLVLGPLGTAALVVIFVIFMLLQREDMRDRMIRLISRGQYMVTTRALNDAGKRISRYMLAQAAVNGTYGIAITLGLWVIGWTLGGGVSFPSAVLWGLLCAVLRFIPYVGPWIAAAFPLAISLAVYPGFGVFAATAALFVVIELVSNNVMEPWLYGASTGISTVAILVAAVFWTWLWGPIGLLLSTPLTVCLVVMGKYVPQLKFLDVLLGDQPALPPHVTYYQRLLAGDRREAADVAKEHAEAKGADEVPDDVLIPALLLARRDRQRSGLSAEDETLIYDATADVVASLEGGEGPPSPATSPVLVLGCPAHHKVEELVIRMLAQQMRSDGCRVEGVSTRALPAEIEARVEREKPALVFIAVLPPGGLEQARYLCRRLRRRFRDLRIVVGYWGRARNFDRLLVRFRSSGASYVTTSLAQSRSQIRALLPAPAPEPERPTTGPTPAPATA